MSSKQLVLMRPNLNLLNWLVSAYLSDDSDEALKKEVQTNFLVLLDDHQKVFEFAGDTSIEEIQNYFEQHAEKIVREEMSQWVNNPQLLPTLINETTLQTFFTLTIHKDINCFDKELNDKQFLMFITPNQTYKEYLMSLPDSPEDPSNVLETNLSFYFYPEDISNVYDAIDFTNDHIQELTKHEFEKIQLNKKYWFNPSDSQKFLDYFQCHYINPEKIERI